MGVESGRFWDKIDAILIVNLAHRTDRWENITRQLDAIGVLDKVHRIDAINGRKIKGFNEFPWFRKTTPEQVAFMKGGSAGCCLSQKKAVDFALEQGFERILLMEDDALFKDNLTGTAGDLLADIMEQDDAWDMIYLGFYQKMNYHWVGHEIDTPELSLKAMRIRGPLMNHAIVMNRKTMQGWSRKLPTEKNVWPWMTYWGSIDAWVQNYYGRSRKVKIWGTAPRLVVQEANQSDIVGTVLSVAESEGTHRPSKEIPLSREELENRLDLSMAERLHQTCKRGLRVIRAAVTGYRKT